MFVLCLYVCLFVLITPLGVQTPKCYINEGVAMAQCLRQYTFTWETCVWFQCSPVWVISGINNGIWPKVHQWVTLSFAKPKNRF